MRAPETEEPKVAEAGAVLAGKLRVERVIGKGSMGVVYEATDLSRNMTRVAVKVMAAELLADLEQRRRFAREGRAATALTSEHAVRVYEVGEADGAPYIEMELLAGRSRESVVDKDGPLPVSSVAHWILQALDAVGEAHANGLVHRDIKPANLFLTDRTGKDPIVKVLDFGLAKDIDPAAQRLTKTGDAMGTPAYMAPEQVRATQHVDARADIWSFGASMHELLTGQLPFPAPTIADMLTRILREDPENIATKRADVPPALLDVIRKCLAKDRKDRYASTDELADALEEATLGPNATAPFRRRRRGPPTGTALMAPIGSAAKDHPSGSAAPKRVDPQKTQPLGPPLENARAGSQAPPAHHVAGGAAGTPPPRSALARPHVGSRPPPTLSSSPGSDPKPGRRARTSLLPIFVASALAVIVLGAVVLFVLFGDRIRPR